jgi:hypothetical protein
MILICAVYPTVPFFLERFVMVPTSTLPFATRKSGLLRGSNPASEIGLNGRKWFGNSTSGQKTAPKALSEKINHVSSLRIQPF